MEAVQKYTDLIIKGLVYVLFIIICFFCKETYNQINTLNLSVNELRLEITHLRSEQITEDRVRELIKLELQKR